MSFLDELKLVTRALQQDATVDPDAQERNQRLANEACRTAHGYWTELCAQLNLIQAPSAARYVLDGRQPLQGLVCRNFRVAPHLRLMPGSDAILANGLLHVLIQERLIDEFYIRDRTEGFEAVRAHAATFWPERVERLTGVPQRDIVLAARTLGLARNALILTARGAEQQSQGVGNVLAFINLALAMGRVGRPYNGYGCLTGQGNGQGGREHGQKADQLPGYLRIDDESARERIGSDTPIVIRNVISTATGRMVFANLR